MAGNAQIFQMVGGVVILAGLALFAIGKGSGDNKLTIGPVEVFVSTPSLFIVTCGILLFCFPFTQYFKDDPSRYRDEATKIDHSTKQTNANSVASRDYSTRKLSIKLLECKLSEQELMRARGSISGFGDIAKIDHIVHVDTSGSEVDFYHDFDRGSAQNLVSALSSALSSSFFDVALGDGTFITADKKPPVGFVRVVLVGSACSVGEPVGN